MCGKTVVAGWLHEICVCVCVLIRCFTQWLLPFTRLYLLMTFPNFHQQAPRVYLTCGVEILDRMGYPFSQRWTWQHVKAMLVYQARTHTNPKVVTKVTKA